MRKPAFCKCENKDADQLRGNREADQRLCFRYINSTIPLHHYKRNFQHLAIFYGCIGQFVSDLVGNPEDRFSQNEAQMIFCFVVAIFDLVHAVEAIFPLPKLLIVSENLF